MRTYGYCRISRKTQNIERQERDILAVYPKAKIVKEAYTGTKISRPEFDKLLRKVKAGDTIVFESVSRMSRSAADGFALYKELYNKGISLVFLKEHHIDTAAFKDAMQGAINVSVDSGDAATDELIEGLTQVLNKFMMNKVEKDIQKAFEQAQKEVDDLHQRTSEGMETARLNGKQIGQPKGAKLTTKKSLAVKALIQKHSKDFGGSLSDPEVIKLAGCSRNSFYKYKAELREGQQA